MTNQRFLALAGRAGFYHDGMDSSRCCCGMIRSNWVASVHQDVFSKKTIINQQPRGPRLRAPALGPEALRSHRDHFAESQESGDVAVCTMSAQFCAEQQGTPASRPSWSHENRRVRTPALRC